MTLMKPPKPRRGMLASLKLAGDDAINGLANDVHRLSTKVEHLHIDLDELAHEVRATRVAMARTQLLGTFLGALLVGLVAMASTQCGSLLQ